MYSTPWEGPGEIYLARVPQNADSTSLVFCIREKTSYVFGWLTHLFVPPHEPEAYSRTYAAMAH
jgi:hypothetical protein